ncbi:hypothetical protein L226DRAFT_572528 [Lentinus tigrinus ALCF2SS1-7]|uniref:Uncharacterized protein n=1 Tax=Lentinus tigrinus ALCF2SS1-6 TaxID=1328759 RepID=A0A5C2S362_9APHY|nr:hypothetical protein L227DRAFT_613871 [Lentinus tigrinus ALCF2SS1-6]RPD73080.1 hypothetical protein L226DRAFT_572528 [Lentinus tigrinus ALCF2SS1-7]
MPSAWVRSPLAYLMLAAHYANESVKPDYSQVVLALYSSIMASLNPPQEAPKWTHTPGEILKLSMGAVEEERVRLDKIAALTSEECTFESVFVSTPLPLFVM